jgi:hypothetical protein
MAGDEEKNRVMQNVIRLFEEKAKAPAAEPGKEYNLGI